MILRVSSHFPMIVTSRDGKNIYHWSSESVLYMYAYIELGRISRSARFSERSSSSVM